MIPPDPCVSPGSLTFTKMPTICLSLLTLHSGSRGAGRWREEVEPVPAEGAVTDTANTSVHVFHRKNVQPPHSEDPDPGIEPMTFLLRGHSSDHCARGDCQTRWWFLGRAASGEGCFLGIQRLFFALNHLFRFIANHLFFTFSFSPLQRNLKVFHHLLDSHSVWNFSLTATEGVA